LLDQNLPPSGTYNAVVTFPGHTSGAIVGVASFNNVNQVLPANTATSVDANPPLVTITTQKANSWLVDTIASFTNAVADPSQTVLWDPPAGTQVSGGGSYKATTTTGSY